MIEAAENLETQKLTTLGEFKLDEYARLERELADSQRALNTTYKIQFDQYYQSWLVQNSIDYLIDQMQTVIDEWFEANQDLARFNFKYHGFYGLDKKLRNQYIVDVYPVDFKFGLSTGGSSPSPILKTPLDEKEYTI